MDKHWKDDIISGFIIFLIALPLSIGIALAAGVPASAGILSAIIGGIIGTLITGTHITISGPAAGLIVVISSAVVTLGEGDLTLGFKRMLAAVVVAGILQIILGVLKLGKLTFLCPTSVVHGMLAAIGIIIVVKQVPVLLGIAPHHSSIPGIIQELPALFVHNNHAILLIGGLSFAVLVLWKYLPKKISTVVPGPLVAVAIGLGFSYYMHIDSPHSVSVLGGISSIGPKFLVAVPKSIKDLFIFPTFDVIFTMKSIISIITIFIVGSLESLLSAYAIDKLDPYKRKSDLDFDIIGKGVANICCGLLGAYPIITEIVRSSANISNGAKTKWANMFHGLFILLFVALLPSVINHIPLTALASVLILVGFNLAHPKEFIHVWHTGKDQFFIFCLTLIVTLVEDLLIGIAVGIIAKLILHFIRGVKPKELFKPKITVTQIDGCNKIELHSNIVFLGYLNIQKQLSTLNLHNGIDIVKNGFYIDHTMSEFFKEINCENKESGH